MKYSYRFVIIAALFVTCLMTANIIAVKVWALGPVSLSAAVIIFPFSYIFGDILTEVYGYKEARKIIWLGFLCNLLFVIFAWFAQLLPSVSGWAGQSAFVTILGYTPRILGASFLGYLVGEFANSFVIAKMKIFTKGRWLWSRTVGSTVVGQAFDTSIFIVGAYIGAVFFSPWMIFWAWAAKVVIEVAFTPFTYLIVNYLKRSESIDTYDFKTDFNPLRLKERKTADQ